MAGPDTFNVKNLDQLQAKFAQVPKEVGARVLKNMAASGAKVVRDNVKVVTPVASKAKRRGGQIVPPGTLRRSVILKFKREDTNDNQAVFLVTARKGKAAQQQLRATRGGAVFTQLSADGFYAPFVERGHRYVPRAKKSSALPRRGSGITLRRRASTKTVPPHPFFEIGFKASRDQAAEAMVERGSTDIQKVIDA